MTTFGDMVKNALSKGLMGAVETLINYVPRNGTAVEDVPARLGPVRDELETGEISESSVATRSCRISKANVASPDKDDTVIIGGETWSVVDIHDETDFAATLELIKVEQGERHGENYYTEGSRR